MKLQTIRIDNTDRISIVNIGDVHFGNPNCDREGFRNIVKKIKNEKDTYWVSTGDLLEVALIGSLGDVYKSQSLQDELQEVADILKPISKKCLGIVGSNHHERLEKKTGLNLDSVISMWLGIPYLGYFGFLRIIVKGIGFYICMHHGFGFGRSQGSKTNNMLHIGQVVKGFDVYLTGHSHSYSVIPETDRILDRKHNKVVERNVYYVCTGHFLNYKGSYAEKKALKLKPKWCAKIDLIANGNPAHKCIKVNPLEVS